MTDQLSDLTFKSYQNASRLTAIYPNVGENFVYPALGLCGEAGEVAEVVKKVLRDGNGRVTPELILKIEKELGDVLWYVAQLATELHIDLEAIARNNLSKLASRKERGTLQGSGNDR